MIFIAHYSPDPPLTRSGLSGGVVAAIVIVVLIFVAFAILALVQYVPPLPRADYQVATARSLISDDCPNAEVLECFASMKDWCRMLAVEKSHTSFGWFVSYSMLVIRSAVNNFGVSIHLIMPSMSGADYRSAAAGSGRGFITEDEVCLKPSGIRDIQALFGGFMISA